jgi:Acetyltransferase (GNAT) domain
MLEMVVTDPLYRQRGLVRQQIEHFHAVVAQRGFDLSIIQGIPYYYRQYGYGYALDHTGLTALAAWRIPDASTDTPSSFYIRPATVDDVADLTRLYQATMAQHQIFVERSAADWHYLLQHKNHPAQLVIEGETGRSVGYFVPASQGSPLRLYEHGVVDYGAGLAILQVLKQRGGSEVQIAGPATDRLVALARTLGGVGLPVADQWLWRIPDLASLLNKLAPLLTRRLIQAGCGDFSGTLCLNLYRQAYALQINRGQIEVARLGFVDASMGADGGDLCIPPEAFIRLLLGYRSLEQLRDSWPDIGVKAESRYLIEALFPGLTAHLLMPY